MKANSQSNTISAHEMADASLDAMKAGMAIPLDPKQFADAFEVWAETEANLPSSDCTAPICIASTVQYLMSAKVENIPSYMIRLMSIQQLYAAHEGALSPFFKSGEDGSLYVDLSLIEAAATAKFIVTKDFVGFDIDDVASRAAFHAAGAPDSEGIH